jgi:hypothetical protein
MVFLMVHTLVANVCLLRYLNPTNDHGTFVSADIFLLIFISSQYQHCPIKHMGNANEIDLCAHQCHYEDNSFFSST